MRERNLRSGSRPGGRSLCGGQRLHFWRLRLSLGKRPAFSARVVTIPVINDDGEEVLWWYLTNLSRKHYAPETLRELYRLRWQVELLWKTLKGRFRLDDIEALTEHNVRLIMESAVLAYFLSLAVLDATTTSTERKKLTVGRMALLFPFVAGGLARLATTDDPAQEGTHLVQGAKGIMIHERNTPKGSPMDASRPSRAAADD